MLHQIPILTFHSLGKHTIKRPYHFLSLYPNIFDAMMCFLKEKGYISISLDDYYKFYISGKSLPKKSIVITFDDGFLDNYVFASNILKKYGFTATLFISPEFVDDRPIKRNAISYEKIIGYDRDLEQWWGYLSWKEIYEMVRTEVFDIQSHTMTHTWWPISPKLAGLYNENSNAYWLWWNKYRDKKPVWLTEFKPTKLDRYTPIFENSRAIGRKRFIPSDTYVNYIVKIADRYMGDINKIKELLDLFPINEKGSYETGDDYIKRLEYEIKGSKDIIENNLNKEINFIAWPGGVYNKIAIDIASKAGYKGCTAKNGIRKADKLIPLIRFSGWSGLNIQNNQFPMIEILYLNLQLLRCQTNFKSINLLFKYFRKTNRLIYSKVYKNDGELRAK